MSWRRVPPDHISISELRRVTYNTEEDISPGDFANKYEELFPVILHVSVGYCGQNAIDFTFSSDEVYLVTHVLTQERVILKDSRDQNLSFPVDHRLKFHTIIEDEKSNKAKKLQDIITSEEISMTSATVFLEPVDTQGPSIQFCVGPDKTVKLPMERMELVETYDERYIVGNSITHETLHFQPFIIPLWMPISVNIATGIRDSTEQKFSELMQDLTIKCRDFKNSTFPGNKEIMLFTGDINEYEGPYDLIAPNNSEYCALPPKRDLKLYDDTEKAAPELPDRKPDPKPMHASKEHRKVPSVPKHDKGILNKIKVKFGKGKEKVDSEGYLVAHTDDVQSYDGLSSGTGITKLNTYVRSDDVAKSSDADIPYTRAKKTIEYPLKPIKGNDENDDDEGSYDEEYETFDVSALSKKKDRRSLPPIPGKEKSSSITQSGSTGSQDVSGDGVVKPKTAPKPAPKTMKKTVPAVPLKSLSLDSNEDTEYASYKEIPKTLKGMSIKQVSECLKILHMDKHIARFEEEDIDGELLADLTSDDLKEFGFTNFQIKKMVKFQNGWRPNKGEAGSTDN